MNRLLKTCLKTVLLIVTLNVSAVAEEPQTLRVVADESAETPKTTLKRLTIVGEDANIRKVPGSVHLLANEDLENAKTGQDDVHRILRQIPGVNIQEEDGYGLRPNIGFRGVSSERSAKITLMEDGVLIAPAPYTAPAAYYFPTAGRMEVIEVTKGPGQIKYGPHTIAGAVNMLSTAIPDKRKAKLKTQIGSDSYKQVHGMIGESYTYGGAMLETYQAETDGFKNLDAGTRDTGFDVNDYVLKGRINTDRKEQNYQEFELKLNFYDQLSNETYMGLTQEDFDADPMRRYAASQLDQIDVDHRTAQLQHYGEISDGLDITTTGYYHKTNRNWYKTDKIGGEAMSAILDDPITFAEQFSWIRGDANSPDDAISMRNNNRSYTSKGVQSVVGATFETGKASHELEVGVRYHEDEEDRYQDDDLYRMDNKTLVRTTDGLPGTQENRIGEAEAFSTFVQDTVTINELTLKPGMRWEHIDYTRTSFAKGDTARTGIDKSVGDSKIVAFIPGVGAHYQITEILGASSGVHKGITPPGATGNGEIEEEESVNYEVGIDAKLGSVTTELIGFYNDYDNLLGFDSLSAGGTGSGDAFNAGKAESYGLELSASANALEHMSETQVEVPVKIAYTLQQSKFRENFSDSLFGLVEKGDEIPYIPENQLYASFGVKYQSWQAHISGHYVDEMLAYAGDAAKKADAKTDDHVVFDLHSEVAITQNVSLFGTIENLFDEEYVVARRPAGARPGQPRVGFAGIKIDL